MPRSVSGACYIWGPTKERRPLVAEHHYVVRFANGRRTLVPADDFAVRDGYVEFLRFGDAKITARRQAWQTESILSIESEEVVELHEIVDDISAIFGIH